MLSQHVVTSHMEGYFEYCHMTKIKTMLILNTIALIWKYYIALSKDGNTMFLLKTTQRKLSCFGNKIR